ncbi:MAG: zinc metallopeptidase [Deltaproteobacteria bacterium]|jgi:archaemetzincin|nr:zinc metallopeptidase [Deltaproteobacteria bacterium]
MPSNGFSLGIQPIGEIDNFFLKVITGSFLGELSIKTFILPPLKSPEYAFNKRKIQYDAGLIINRMEKMKFPECTKVIGIIDADLFIPVFSYVLGEARMKGRCAIISLFRLENNPERMAKVALHEFGHLMNLKHCQEKGCVMKFSNNVEQLDSNFSFFCEYCIDQLNYLLKK